MSNFTQAQITAAQAAQKKWAVPASVTLAQFAIESGYGKYMPGGPSSYNGFGIKAAGNQPYVVSRTREVINGKSVYIDAKFRKFSGWAEAFDEHGRLLATVGVYHDAMVAWRDHHDLDGGVCLMGRHYATAPDYATVILSVIHSQALQQFDQFVGA